MEISRRTFSGTGLALSAQTAAPPPPNIVFLLSDDHTAADLGCSGNTHVRTPNLDRLAREGVRFANCFVASPQLPGGRLRDSLREAEIAARCGPLPQVRPKLHGIGSDSRAEERYPALPGK